MLISWAVIIVAILGLLIYILAGNPKVQELGRIAFSCGLLVACLMLAGKTVQLFAR
jgi:Na+/phosphate symporter